MTNISVGKSLPRVEGAAKVTGAMRYTADIIRPGNLWGKILHSPLPHARILHIDTSKATALPGVKAVITGADVAPRLVGATIRDLPVLARERVRYSGEDVAAVAAVDQNTAEEAVHLIEVEYEELPAVFDPLQAIKAESPLLHPDYDAYIGSRVTGLKNVQSAIRKEKGDFEKGLVESDFVFENVFRTQMVHQAYIEPYACTVEVDLQGRVAVWVTDQGYFKLRRELAEYLELPEEDITVYPSTMGGSFGAKDFLFYVPVAYHLSKTTGKPVRFIRTYAEELLASAPRHPAVVVLRSGVKKEGILWAWEGKTFYNGGAYAAFRPNPQASMSGALMVAGSYSIPHTRIEGSWIYTNQVPCGYFRAPGEPQTRFAVESQIDLIAEAMGWDPMEFRCRNVLKEGDISAIGEAIRHPQGLNVLRKAAAVSRWRKRRSRTGDTNTVVGRGIAFGDRHIGSGESSFRLLLDPNGTFKLVSGVGDTGVGSHTMHRQVAAEVLGVDPYLIEIEVQETTRAPFDEGIKATRGAHVEGQAVVRAAESLISQLRRIAASHWSTDVNDVSWLNGKVLFRRKGRSQNLSFRELAALSNEPICGFGHYVGKKPDFYSFQAVIADIQIDRDTGQIELKKVYFVLDVGTIINPLIHQGQIEGGFVQGLGYTLTEEMLLDEGRVTTLSMGEYKIPSIRDIPRLITSLVRCEEGPGPFGAKAVGQVAISLVAPAMANAVYDATGVRITQLPITPEKIIKGLTSGGLRTRAKQI